MKNFSELLICLTMVLTTVLYVGGSTIAFAPFSIKLDRPWTAVAVALILVGMLVYLFLGLQERLKP